mmetsp:Transcript_64891/g.208978  ORF Transcript_64891/g.208978 Transcript_64891/m.208978 type:complete len:580 (-) Transcript_64891:459-2198(-)
MDHSWTGPASGGNLSRVGCNWMMASGPGQRCALSGSRCGRCLLAREYGTESGDRPLHEPLDLGIALLAPTERFPAEMCQQRILHPNLVAQGSCAHALTAELRGQLGEPRTPPRQLALEVCLLLLHRGDGALQRRDLLLRGRRLGLGRRLGVGSAGAPVAGVAGARHGQRLGLAVRPVALGSAGGTGGLRPAVRGRHDNGRRGLRREAAAGRGARGGRHQGRRRARRGAGILPGPRQRRHGVPPGPSRECARASPGHWPRDPRVAWADARRGRRAAGAAAQAPRARGARGAARREPRAPCGSDHGAAAATRAQRQSPESLAQAAGSLRAPAPGFLQHLRWPGAYLLQALLQLLAVALPHLELVGQAVRTLPLELQPPLEPPGVHGVAQRPEALGERVGARELLLSAALPLVTAGRPCGVRGSAGRQGGPLAEGVFLLRPEEPGLLQGLLLRRQRRLQRPDGVPRRQRQRPPGLVVWVWRPRPLGLLVVIAHRPHGRLALGRLRIRRARRGQRPRAAATGEGRAAQAGKLVDVEQRPAAGGAGAGPAGVALVARRPGQAQRWSRARGREPQAASFGRGLAP